MAMDGQCVEAKEWFMTFRFGMDSNVSTACTSSDVMVC